MTMVRDTGIEPVLVRVPGIASDLDLKVSDQAIDETVPAETR